MGVTQVAEAFALLNSMERCSFVANTAKKLSLYGVFFLSDHGGLEACVWEFLLQKYGQVYLI